MKSHLIFPVVLAFWAALFTTSCGRAPNPEPATRKAGPEPSRQDLIAALVAKGDRLADDGDFARAEATYTLAELYTVDPSIPPKAEAARRAAGTRELTKHQADTVAFALRHRGLALRDPWPDPTPELDEVELRMLLDETVVADHRRTRVTVDGASAEAELFLRHTAEHVKWVPERYGKPTTETVHGVLTYGRIRIAVEGSGFVAAIFLRPIKSR
jgi:hypothetical protein